VGEALHTPAGRALVDTVEHPGIGAYEAVRNPVRIDGQRIAIGSAPPSLGQHTASVLREIGLGVSVSKTKTAAGRHSQPSRRPARR
jgi:crotonobetainyl-CoA:carnitine CoA-transferase CaiB-like acyl-CoA transferase